LEIDAASGTKYTLSLLGRLRLERDGFPVNGFESRKAQALLGYLAVQGQPVTRSHLADLFWSDKPEARGRGNLSRVLNNLAALLPGCFETDYHTIGFFPGPHLQLDLTAFAVHLAAGDVFALWQALALYRGDFLAGLSLPDCPDFEAWLLAEREGYARQVTGLLETLINHALVGQDYPTAQALTARLLGLNPALEAGHRQMMWLLATAGQPQAALSHYQTCRRHLEQQLHAVPAPETVTLVKLIRRGEATTVGPYFLNQRRQPAPPLNPYRGLNTFTEVDAPFFFGRETFVERLLTILTHMGLVAVIGPSGSGKSSVVQAGVLPHLRREGWLVIPCRLGHDPFFALAESLIPFRPTAPLASIDTLAGQLISGEMPPAQWFAAADCPRLLLLDQFEELFTLCPDFVTRQRFLDLLLVMTADPPALPVLLTLRAAFMNEALAYRPLAEVLQAGSLLLGPMSRQELSRAIVCPVERVGGSFEPGLVERLLDDVGGEAGRLPLLEFALTSLWNQAGSGRLTHAAYQAIGQVQGGLTHYAEHFYHHLSQAEQAQLPRLLARLVRFGDQSPDTRRPATRAELGETGWELAEKLVSARLLVSDYRPNGTESVELVHEALLAHWDRLKEWLNQDRAFRLWQDELRLAMRHWHEGGDQPEDLLQGGRLTIARGWFSKRAADLSLAEAQFIRASLQRQEQAQAIIHQTQQAQERQRRRTTVGLAGGLLVALILTGLAGWGWWQAMRLRRVSLPHELAPNR
jgi:DNA-binding SARP family transcriptional activator